MRLPARLSYSARSQYIGTVAVASAKSVTGQLARCRRRPGHNHPAIQSAGQRHPDRLAPAKIAFENTRKGLPQALVIFRRRQTLLLFPFSHIEVALPANLSILSYRPFR